MLRMVMQPLSLDYSLIQKLYLSDTEAIVFLFTKQYLLIHQHIQTQKEPAMFFKNKKREIIDQVKYPPKDYPGFLVNKDAVIEPYESKRNKMEKADAQSKSWNG
jgi:hypothetical protein